MGILFRNLFLILEFDSPSESFLVFEFGTLCFVLPLLFWFHFFYDYCCTTDEIWYDFLLKWIKGLGLICNRILYGFKSEWNDWSLWTICWVILKAFRCPAKFLMRHIRYSFVSCRISSINGTMIVFLFPIQRVKSEIGRCRIISETDYFSFVGDSRFIFFMRWRKCCIFLKEQVVFLLLSSLGF